MGGRGSSSATGRTKSAEMAEKINELLSSPNPPMPQDMVEAKRLADKYKGLYEEKYELVDNERAAINLMYDEMERGDLEKLAFGSDFIELYFSSFIAGDEPEYVYAIRYGDVPASGRSTNWAEGTKESGVSTIKIIRNPEDIGYKSIYDVTLGLRGSDKIVVGGWYVGRSGSDGEPLLHGAKKIMKLD